MMLQPRGMHGLALFGSCLLMQLCSASHVSTPDHRGHVLTGTETDITISGFSVQNEAVDSNFYSDVSGTASGTVFTVPAGAEGLLHLRFSEELKMNTPPEFSHHDSFFKGWQLTDNAAMQDAGLAHVDVDDPIDIDFTTYTGQGMIYVYRKDGENYVDKEIIFADSSAVSFKGDTVTIRLAKETLVDGDAEYAVYIEPRTFQYVHYHSVHESYVYTTTSGGSQTRYRYKTLWDRFDAPAKKQQHFTFFTGEYAGDCSGHGTLLNGTCTCDAGWKGEACAQRVCNGHGVVYRGDVCYCDSGWTFKPGHPEVDQCVKRKLPRNLIYKAGDRKYLLRTITPDVNVPLGKLPAPLVYTPDRAQRDQCDVSYWKDVSGQSHNSGSFKGISFYNFNQGIAVGSGGLIFRTLAFNNVIDNAAILANGGAAPTSGESWEDITGPGFETLNSVVMTGSKAFVAVGENSGVVVSKNANFAKGSEKYLTSKNGGVRCKVGNTNTNCDAKVELDRVALAQGSTSRLYAVGDKNHVRQSSDGGVNWVQLDTKACNSENVFWHGVFFTSEDLGFIVGQSGHACKTTDGGRTWTPLTRYANESDTYYSNLHSVYGTKNFGKNQVLDTEQTEITDTASTFYDTYFIAGADGFLCRSTDELETCVPVPNLPRVEILSIDFHDSNSGVAVGRGGYTFYTYDNGQSWVTQGPHTSVGADYNSGARVGCDGTVCYGCAGQGPKVATTDIYDEFYTVTMVNTHPSAVAETISVLEDTRFDSRLPGLDQNGDSFRFEITTQPSRGVVTITEAVSGLYSFMPNLNKIATDSGADSSRDTKSFGPDSFTFAVIDKWSGMSNSATITVYINRHYDLDLIQQVSITDAPLGVALNAAASVPKFSFANSGTYYRYDTYNAFAFFTSNYAGPRFELPSKVIAMRVSNTVGDLQKEAVLDLNGDERFVSCIAIESRPRGDVAAPGYLYVGTVQRPGKIIKVKFEVDRFDQYKWGVPVRSYDYAHALTLQREDALTLPDNEGLNDINCVAVDSTARIGYAGLNTIPGRVVVFNIDTMKYLHTHELPDAKVISTCHVDPSDGTAFFGALFHDTGLFYKITGAKIAKATYTKVVLPRGHQGIASGIIDTSSKKIYYTTSENPSKLSAWSYGGTPKLLKSVTMQVVDEGGKTVPVGFPMSAGFDLNAQTTGSTKAEQSTDGPLGYFVARGMGNRQDGHAEPPRTVKFKLDDLSVVSSLTLNVTAKDYFPVEAFVVDPQQGVGYAATNSDPSWMLKLDL